ncbi:MAG: hypothetical protein IT436_03865 [Phycisphaerales bacterium]|nr:hypothetical protein [Phycisphaerales bacterium]
MKKCVGLLALMALAGAAQAEIVDVGHFVIDRVTGQPTSGGSSADATLERYRNWAAPSTLLAGFAQGLGSLTGDDVNLVAGPALLDTMGFSIYNGNAAGQRLAFADGEIDFFRQSDGSFIGGFLWNADLATILGSGGLDGGSSVRLSFAAGSLVSLGINLESAMYVTQTFTTATLPLGGSDASIGQQIRNPPAIGTSADLLIIGGVITTSPFAGNPVGNMSWTITTTDVPAPGAVALLGLGGLVAGRRRR